MTTQKNDGVEEQCINMLLQKIDGRLTREQLFIVLSQAEIDVYASLTKKGNELWISDRVAITATFRQECPLPPLLIDPRYI